MRIEHPQREKLQQGAIFTCVAVPGYENCRCSGIVLTARCDLEHRKYTAVSYLPIVPFDAWASRSLTYILARRLRSEIYNDISSALAKKGVSNLLLETFPLKEIVTKETKGNERDSLLKKCESLDLVSELESLEGRYSKKAGALVKLAGKKCDKVIEELIQQKLGEYYFLESVDVYSPVSIGYVVLLRQMRTMSCDWVEKVLGGVTAAEVSKIEGGDRELTFEIDPICMVTGVLRSPDIEHLAQHFSALFVRIGLEDYKLPQFETHYAAAKSI